jgi:RNA polymerase sigma-70 factor (ECF subfamily)
MKEREVRMRSALKEISEEHRIAITLREVDGLSYDEIAEVTGVAKGTVMSRLHYARKKIQAAFEEG